MNGIIVIDKEPGFTSFDVVAKMRGICGIKKIGHTGTLDPDATGVLPICVGKATKVCGLLTDSNKEYEAVLHLGVTTDTQDLTGTVLSEKEPIKDEETVRETILSFVGDIEQIPPMYSALKVEGQKLCDLARKGITVERRARKITIYGIDIVKMELPEVTIRVRCSKGTYIRTLCHDIGEKLGCGGAMAKLRRTKAAGFSLEDAYTLKEIQALKKSGEIEKAIHSIDSVYKEYGEAIVLPEGEKLAINGNKIPKNMIKIVGEDTKTIRLYMNQGKFVGIFEYEEFCELYKPVRMFLET